MSIYKAVQSNIASKDKKKKWHPCLIIMGNVVDTQMIGETIAVMVITDCLATCTT